MKVGFISLGCNKNLVDTEKTISIFKENNYEIVNNPKEAEIIVINTCGFIESAKEEAINTILEMAEYKKQKCKYLIAMGCLVERYKKELEKELPEVDLFIKYSEYGDLWKKIQELIKKREEKIDFEQWQDRVITTGKTTAYLKIADGCSNRCTYCAIPYIRGAFKSRPFEDIVEEAKMLAKQGIQEIIVIAQDTTKYGIDLYKKARLAELLHEISKIEGIKWIRFLYSYPEGINEELIQEVRKNDKIAKYFDIPIQHISNKVLKRMNRKTSKENIEKLIKNIKENIPNVVLRTSIIVGFPGETKEDFEQLLEFIEYAKFDKLGAFPYSKEEGTPAAKLPDQIHGNTKKARYNKLMQKQQQISRNNLQKRIGKIEEVLIEDISFDNKYFIGRTMQDVPEIDGIVYIENDKNLEAKDYLNKFIKCEITNINDYDLIAKLP